jgi:CubicO group peptidase (beta-lactamase class C family)
MPLRSAFLLPRAVAALSVVALPSAVAAAAPAAQAGAPVPAVEAGEGLIAALNGEPAAREAFARNGFASAALAREPAATRAAMLDRLASDAGGFRVLEVKPQGERMVEITAATKRGGRFARFVVFTSRAEPGKIANVFTFAARDPAKIAAEAWPTGVIPASRVATEIGKRVAALAADDSFSGAVLVAKGDTILFRRAYGFADADWQAENRPDTLFNIASIGKMFTAVAILKLAEQGAVSLDDPLSKWVPDYPNQAAARKITLRHLLTHQAGLGPWDVRRNDAATAREAARTMTAPPAAEPGAGFAYSNAGYVLLGAVIEGATGRSYEEAVRTLVLDPAGMKRTGFWPVTAIVPNRATGYLRPEEDPLGFGPRRANHQYLGFKGDASGGAYSTVDDLFAFHRALLGNRLLGAAGTQQMLSPKVDFPGTPRPSKYGFGVRLSECASRPVFGHSGGGANSGVSAATYATPDGRWTVIVLANYDPAGEELATDICDFIARQ